jgi:hypothetical protein
MGTMGGYWNSGWMILWGMVAVAVLIMLVAYLMQRPRSY